MRETLREGKAWSPGARRWIDVDVVPSNASMGPSRPRTPSLTISIAEAARISGMSEVTVRRWVADGVVPSTRVAHTRLISRQKFLAIIGVGEEVAA